MSRYNGYDWMELWHLTGKEELPDSDPKRDEKMAEMLAEWFINAGVEGGLPVAEEFMTALAKVTHLDSQTMWAAWLTLEFPETKMKYFVIFLRAGALWS